MSKETYTATGQGWEHEGIGERDAPTREDQRAHIHRPHHPAYICGVSVLAQRQLTQVGIRVCTSARPLDLFLIGPLREIPK